MNERIFEFAEEVNLIQWDILPSGARTPDHESVAKAIKFAEMIVKECITVVDATPLGYGDYRDQILESMRDSCSDRIVYHFGVEG